MRYLSVLVVAGVAFISNSPSFAQEPNQSKAPQFGEYGYRHRDLHERGTIQQLMDVTGKSCCDGGDGGECRVTDIIWANGATFFNHNGLLCPFSIPVNSVNLPLGARAVVCASKELHQDEDGPKGCPVGIYCAGASGGS